MQAPRIPENEDQRLQALRALRLLDTPPEERFDRLTRLVRRVFDVPIALVSLVDESRQWFKSCQGLDVGETDREISFCGHAILDDRVFEVCDALADWRFADNPLVIGPPYIRYYAGRPLRAPGGNRIGTLCMIDRRPRRLSAEDLRVFEDLAALAEAELALVQTQTTDALTGLTNRAGFEVLGALAMRGTQRVPRSAALVSIKVRDLKRVREWLDADAANQALIIMARQLKCAFRDGDVVGRTGDGHFHVLMVDVEETIVDECLERFSQLLERSSHYELRGDPIDFDVVCRALSVPDAEPLSALLDAAWVPAPARTAGSRTSAESVPG